MKGNLFFYMLLSASLGISGLVYATQEQAISEEDYLALLEFQNGAGEQSVDQSSDTSESTDVQEASQSDFTPAPSSEEQNQKESPQTLPQEEAQLTEQENRIEPIAPVYITPARSFDRYRQNQNAFHGTMPIQPTDNSSSADEKIVPPEISAEKTIEDIKSKKSLEPEVDKDKKAVKKPAKNKQKSGKKKQKAKKKQKPKEKKEKVDETDYSTMPMA